MRAMVLEKQNTPLLLKEMPKPLPEEDELLIRVQVCGVCRTDLHILQGDLPQPKLPLILGHEIVGIVEEAGKNTEGFQKGDRVGIPWLGGSCGQCEFCQSGQENLCEHGAFTGYTRNGGFAEYTTCRAAYALHLPREISDRHLAPLLCAGLIGYRSYRKAAPKKTLGLYGFGASAHIIAQIAICEGKQVYTFSRPGHIQSQTFAKKLGAVWSGGSDEIPPQLLDAVIHFAPVGSLIPLSLRALKKGGRCICSGIHMSDIPSFPYSDLWGEKSIQSVANLTRNDAHAFFEVLEHCPVQTSVKVYPLEEANQALDDLKNGRFEGAAVLTIV